MASRIIQSTAILLLLSCLLSAQAYQRQSTVRMPFPEETDSSRVNILIEMADECRYYSPDELIRYNKQALDLSKSSDYHYGEARALKGIAVYYYDNARYDSALFYLEKAELIFRELGESEELVDILGMYCHLCVAQGEYNKAFEFGLRALRSADTLGGTVEMREANSFIGFVYSSIGDFEKSLDHYFTALSMAEESGNNYRLAVLCSEIAMVYDKMEDRDLASRYYDRAAVLLDGENDPYLNGLAQLNRAESLKCRGSYIQSLREYCNAYTTVSGFSDHSTSSRILTRIGQTYVYLAASGADLVAVSQQILLAGFDDIEDLLLKSIELLESSGNVDELVLCLESLSALYLSEQQYQKAFQANQRLISLKDTVAITNQANTLSQMLVAYDIEQQKKSLELLEARTQVNQNRINIQRQQQAIAIIATVVLLLIGFGLFHRIRTIRKIKQKIWASNESLESEKLRAEQGEKFKERFLAHVSHEIRTPMNAIMGITNLLIKSQHFPEQEKYLEAMNTSARHLLVLINDILDLSRLESGKFEMVRKPFELSKLIEILSEELTPFASEKQLSFNVSVDKKIPAVLEGDEHVLHQILLSLLRNAIEYTEKGRIDLVCRLMGSAEHVVLLGFTVRDTGSGIEKELLETLFSKVIGEIPFDRKLFDKSGLELLINKQLIEIQGGTIAVDSKTGKGTTFYFELPFEKVGEGQQHQQQETRTPAPLEGISVLLVEDNEFNVMVARDELEAAIKDVRVDVARDGSIAVEKVASNPYDVILMDIQMPVMDGYDATRAIRKLNGHGSDIPIIAMTANNMRSEVDKCLAAGMDDFISKPFDVRDLINRISRLRT